MCEPEGPLPNISTKILDVIDNLKVTFADVKSEPKNFNIFKACGLDDIHLKLLKSLESDDNFVNSWVVNLV